MSDPSATVNMKDEWAIWDGEALISCANQSVVESGTGQRVSDVHKDSWRRSRREYLQVPWEECEVLRIMFRFCTCCGSFTFWEYFTDGSGQMFGICWSCEYFVRRWRKTYVQGMLYNPIHAPEKVIYDTSEYHKLSGDEIIDIGYTPPTQRELEAVHAVGLIFPEQSRTSGSGGPVTVHLPRGNDAGRD